MHPVICGLAWYMPSIILYILVGVKVLDYDHKIRRKNILKGLEVLPGNLLLLVSILGAIKVENIIQDHFSLGWDFTPLFYSIEGNKHIVWLQTAFTSNLFFHAVAVFYLLAFMGALVLVPTFFLLRNERDLLKKYVYIMVFSYAILVPSYLFFNVSVTSLYPEGTPVEPKLYNNEMYLSLVHLVDRLDDCFPSGHISVPFSLLLLSIFDTKNKRLRWFTFFLLVLTAFSILYLGIHWGLDIVGGLILGAAAYWFSNTKYTKPISSFIDRVNKKFTKFKAYYTYS